MRRAPAIILAHASKILQPFWVPSSLSNETHAEDKVDDRVLTETHLDAIFTILGSSGGGVAP